MANVQPPGQMEIIKAREGTYLAIIHALQGNPAYILVFGIGLLSGLLGMGTAAVGFFQNNTTVVILGFAAWVVLLIASLMVIIFVERRRPIGGGLLATLDQTAREAFLSGPPADTLSGRWKIEWYIGEGAQRHPYGANPEEDVAVATFRSRVSGSVYDPTTKKTYWMDGRLSHPDVLTLTYWSQEEQGITTLAGVAFLRMDNSFEAKGNRLTGWWKGFVREGQGQVSSGEVEWTRLG